MWVVSKIATPYYTPILSIVMWSYKPISSINHTNILLLLLFVQCNALWAYALVAGKSTHIDMLL